jgi:hypothetical protein
MQSDDGALSAADTTVSAADMPCSSCGKLIGSGGLQLHSDQRCEAHLCSGCADTLRYMLSHLSSDSILIDPDLSKRSPGRVLQILTKVMNYKWLAWSQRRRPPIIVSIEQVGAAIVVRFGLCPSDIIHWSTVREDLVPLEPLG